MSILPHLENKHLEALKSAVRIHSLLGTENSCILGKKTWDKYCETVERPKISDELARRYHLAEYTDSNSTLGRNESLKLALDICLETGISKEEFDLACEYNNMVQRTASLELN